MIYDKAIQSIPLRLEHPQRRFPMQHEPSLLDRITIDSQVCHGKPCIRGLRYPVHLILEFLSSGMAANEILSDYPDLEKEDIQACLAFAARLSEVKTIGRVV
jgi:uncharacterized protein (DUF433 family)